MKPSWWNWQVKLVEMISSSTVVSGFNVDILQIKKRVTEQVNELLHGRKRRVGDLASLFMSIKGPISLAGAYPILQNG